MQFTISLKGRGLWNGGLFRKVAGYESAGDSDSVAEMMHTIWNECMYNLGSPKGADARRHPHPRMPAQKRPRRVSVAFRGSPYQLPPVGVPSAA
jgi:hypothetical protein